MPSDEKVCSSGIRTSPLPLHCDNTIHRYHRSQEDTQTVENCNDSTILFPGNGHSQSLRMSKGEEALDVRMKTWMNEEEVIVGRKMAGKAKVVLTSRLNWAEVIISVCCRQKFGDDSKIDECSYFSQ